MSRHRWRSRALHRIERNLVASDPYLDGLFASFAARTGRRWTPRVERIMPLPRRVLARLRPGQPKEYRRRRTDLLFLIELNTPSCHRASASVGEGKRFSLSLL